MSKRITISRRGTIHSIKEEFENIAQLVKGSGKKINNLAVGAPNSGVPKAALNKVIELAKKNKLGYSPATGILELRQRIATFYADKHGVTIDPKRIVVTIGASGAFFITFDILFDQGARIAVPLPSYSSYLSILGSLGLQMVQFSTTLENNFQPTIEELEKLDNLDGLLITNPSNPTGSVIEPKKLKQIVEYCLKRGITLVVDEIYHGIIYDNLPISSGVEYSDQIIIINSFSKYYSMPGWRLGWMVVPEQIVDSVANLARTFFIAPPTPSQYAALYAMDETKELDHHLIRYKHNREILLKEMPKAGFDRFTPMQGAFYFYAHIKHLHEDSIEFCKTMIREAGVVSSPGTTFDPISGQHYVRFAYAGSTEEVERAVTALKKWRK